MDTPRLLQSLWRFLPPSPGFCLEKSYPLERWGLGFSRITNLPNGARHRPSRLPCPLGWAGRCLVEGQGFLPWDFCQRVWSTQADCTKVSRQKAIIKPAETFRPKKFMYGLYQSKISKTKNSSERMIPPWARRDKHLITLRHLPKVKTVYDFMLRFVGMVDHLVVQRHEGGVAAV